MSQQLPLFGKPARENPAPLASLPAPDDRKYPYFGAGSLNRHQVNQRHTDIISRHWPNLVRNGGRPSVGMLAELADVVAGYAQVAAREALSGDAA